MFNLIFRLDSAVEQYINSSVSPFYTGFFYAITKFGSVIVAVIVTLSVAYFLWRRDRGLVRYFAAAVLANEVIVYLAKYLIGRPRPFGALRYGEFDASMPSGHAAISILLYGFIIHLLFRFYPKCQAMVAAILSLGLLIILIGFSRLYLDVHYFSDVVVGYAIGGLILWRLVKFSGQQPRK